MHVILLGQTVVPDRMRGVTRPLHAAQVADAKHILERMPGEAGQKSPGLFLVGQIACTQSCQGRLRPQIVEFFVVRLLVDPVHGLCPATLDLLRHGLVGQQHEFLDQLMGDVVLNSAHFADPPLRVEEHLVLRHVEIQRTGAEPGLAQFLREPVGVVQHLFRFVLRLAVEDRHRLLVGVAMFGADDRGMKSGLLNAPAVGQHELHAARQPVDVRLERAQLVAQLLRQHRDNAIHEIGRVAAAARLLVQCTLGRHVMRNIGDVHPQSPAPTLDSFHRDRVVKVSRVHRVDGDHEIITAIHPPLAIRLRHLRAEASGLSHDLGRESRR